MLRTLAAVLSLVAVSAPSLAADDGSDLRLVPFPKRVRVLDETFSLDRPLVLTASGESLELFASALDAELRRAGHAPVRKRRSGAGAAVHEWHLADAPASRTSRHRLRDDAGVDDYSLDVDSEAVTCFATGPKGLFWGLQTLCQLIRANRTGAAIPCVEIRDWPSLRWRCFQDDLTRGPSSKLSTLQQAVGIGAGLKMNLFTYYMEYQYAFSKHPVIGPPDGSLTPAELGALVEFAAPRQIDILGNQQSFSHFRHILKHEQYAQLREADWLLTPVREETYKLLDDLYSEVIPLLPFPFFNVCCDETWGLGKGPSKELAEKIGVGGVYVGHIRRVHDILKDRYDKRMMMWGDIILNHRDHLDAIPKDTILLTWGYGAGASFEDQITPFAESGFEFFVCPGVSNWSRILPDFGVATTNIRNFVRDGAKHGALGMLNTAWEDDGESLNSPKWHGYAWGAECAWNASTTSLDDFNRRVGGVLFGEKGDHFGRAIELLAAAFRLDGMQNMYNRRFWRDDFAPTNSAAAIRKSAGRLLALTRPALEHLRALRAEATANAELIEGLILGAERMDRIGQRMLDGLAAAEALAQAAETTPQDAVKLIDRAAKLVRDNRDAHEALGKRFAELWLAESKPYALDWTLDRYRKTVARYDALLAKLATARERAAAGEPIDHPSAYGLALPERFARRHKPHEEHDEPLVPFASWAVPEAPARIGVTVDAGSVDREELPIEVDVALPASLATSAVRAFCSIDAGETHGLAAQLDGTTAAGRARLTFIVDQRIPKGARAFVHVYLGAEAPAKLAPGAASTSAAADDCVEIANDALRLVLGPKGGHVWVCEVKAAANRDLTMPGRTGWAGFADTGRGSRHATHEIERVASGPALVRYRLREPSSGLVKTVSLFAGASWFEVTLDEPVAFFWNYDDPAHLAADGSKPSRYLFSGGATGDVGKAADGVPGQVNARGVRWGVKFATDGTALGIATPEVAAHHHIGPGGTAGGVGIEKSAPCNHFVTYAGVLDKEPAQVMQALTSTLDFANPPRVEVWAIEKRPE